MANTHTSELPIYNAADCVSSPDNEPDDERAESLKKIADVLMADYAVSHSAAIIEAAISVFEEVLRLRPRGKEHRAEALGDLGDALELFCVHNETDQSRRSRCFDLLREALQLCPPGHSSRERVLHSLARALHFVGYERQGDLENLRESILLNRAAMQLRPPGHCKRGDSLNNLACGLARLFEHCGDLNLLAEAITLLREQLELRPVGHPNRDTFLHNLAHALHASFEYQGGSETIAEAISIYRDTLQLRPVGHPLRWATLSDFSHALSLSHAPKGFLESSSESTSLSREAVELLPSTHPGRGPVLGYLGQHLVARYRQCHDHSAIAEGIALLRESLSLLTGHPGHAEVLNNLAEALIASFDAHGRFDHLLEAVMLRREALGHRPPGHSQRMESLQRLARLLCRPECQSWTEALALYYEAMNICPIGSRLRSEMLSDASICFLDPESPFFDLSQGLEHLTAAYSDNFSHVNQRLRSAMSDLARIERAYNKAVTNLDGPSVEHCKIQVLNLYAQVIALLPRAANFGLDHNTRLQAITGLDQISRDAAARAILLGHASQALEMLEEGRGVFWAQSLHLRYSAFEDVPPEDSQELQRILRLLEYTARRAESPDHNAAQRERDLEMRRQLNDEAESLILKIRGYPGFNRFLLPSAFDALVSALPDGFVVIVNASKLGNHALLLHKGTALATCLKLQPPPTGFDSTTLRSQLPRDMASSTDEGDTRAMRKIVSCEGSFLDVLAVLWNTIVQPIVTQLGLQSAVGRARPRLWWCVTGELGFLPIHAAGNYRDASPVCAADYVTSSYVPTLSSLTKARSSWNPIPRTQLAGLLVCEDSSGREHAVHLPEAAEEVRIVRACFDSAHARVLNALSAHTSLSELRSLLEHTPANILHLACHGIHDPDALKSALVLQDGNFTIQDIMDLHLPSAILAVLSACQTAKGDRNAPDQAVHLVASMLFCGFRSVIGTMWLMHDEDGPKVARKIYEALFRCEAFDLDDVPYALDEAVQALRKAGVPAQRWAPFMHMGG